MELAGLIVTIVGLALGAAALYYTRLQATMALPTDVGDEEFHKSLTRHQTDFSKIIPEGNIYRIWSNGTSRFELINGNIIDASTEIIVSSDDNLFSASGGVAKAIVAKAGKQVMLDLAALRRFRWRHGSMAVTRAGKFPSRYLVHPVIIDHRHNLYPNENLVREVTERCLRFADTVDADSISLPVFGGGTGSKNLNAAQSVRAITSAVVSRLNAPGNEIEYVALYVYNKDDIPSELSKDTKINESQ